MTAVSMVFIAEILANFDGDVSRALPTILAVFLLAGLIQIILGFIGLGKYIRTVVNINAGGKTRLSGMIAGLLLLFILLAIGPIASQIPAAVLAGILITVGIGVMDYKGLRAIPFMPRTEVVFLIVVLVLSSVWNLVYAVGIGLVIASLMFIKK